MVKFFNNYCVENESQKQSIYIHYKAWDLIDPTKTNQDAKTAKIIEKTMTPEIKAKYNASNKNVYFQHWIIESALGSHSFDNYTQVWNTPDGKFPLPTDAGAILISYDPDIVSLEQGLAPIKR